MVEIALDKYNFIVLFKLGKLLKEENLAIS